MLSALSLSPAFGRTAVSSSSPAFGRATGLGAAAVPRPSRLEVSWVPTETSWLSQGAFGGRIFRLSAEPLSGLLERFLEPFRNHTPEWRALFRGPYGPAQHRLVPELQWSLSECAPAEHASEVGPSFGLDLSLEPPARAGLGQSSLSNLLALPEPELVPAARARYCPPWQRPRPVTFLRPPGRESDRIALLDCEGGVSADALDRLSVLARPAGVPRPELPLPLEPEAEHGEWVSEVRLLSPRLVWAVSRIAEAFPGRAIELVSGYRRSGHGNHHARGLALDLVVRGVPKEAVFKVCRQLSDAGCGYYPESSFVHLDVRRYGSGHVAWVDVSRSGEPPAYVAGWPGVLSPDPGRAAPEP